MPHLSIDYASHGAHTDPFHPSMPQLQRHTLTGRLARRVFHPLQAPVQRGDDGRRAVGVLAQQVLHHDDRLRAHVFGLHLDQLKEGLRNLQHQHKRKRTRSADTSGKDEQG